eukprot:5514539-Pleurochrysis_carterae.AAC.1
MLDLVGGTIRTCRPTSASHIGTPDGRTADRRRHARNSHPSQRDSEQLRTRGNGRSQAGWQLHFRVICVKGRKITLRHRRQS